MKSWEEALISPSTTVRSALETIDQMGCQIALVVDESRRLLGTVSDGDVRRALLEGKRLDSLVHEVMHVNPTTVSDQDDRHARLAKMRRNVLHQLPVIDSNGIVVGLETGKLMTAGREIELPASVRCITALAFARDGSLWLANGSAIHSPSAWAADLMQKGSSGSVWKRDAGATAFRQIASGLAFPNGLYVEASDVVVSESWRHRLVSIDGAGKLGVIIDHLPGYPARLAPSPDGGVWLSVFAPRNRLIEFVLEETHYRHDMIESVPRDYWIAPSLASSRSFLEPLQCGAIRSMGVHKPWSPTRSYGMVVRLDATLQPVSSVHSRANGTRHGTTSALEHDGKLLVASRGGDCILAIDLMEAF